MDGESAAAVSWRDGPLAAFDVETTGTDTAYDRVVSATVATWESGRGGLQVRKWMINPGVPIPVEATAVHHLTDADVAARGRAPGEALGEIADVLRAWWSRELPVVIYNAAFDVSLTRAELLRHLGLGLDPGFIIDPWVIDKALDRYRPGSRRLDPTATHHGVPLVGPAHDDSVDALGAMRLAWRLAGVYPQIGTMPLARLQEDQAIKYAEQQASYERHACDQLARAGRWDEAMTLRLSRDWPMVPLPQDWRAEQAPADDLVSAATG